jgi:predicted ATPase/class 3 adenylate cyclase
VPGLPSGTVTFLFTDVEGSTRLWEEQPELMSAALALHDDIVRDAVEAAGGVVFGTRGDGFAAVFARAGDAVDAAVATQHRLAALEWPDDLVVRARMSLHTGEAQERDGDYFGSAVNRAARLMATAHGGQIVCSRATADVLRDALPGGVSLVDLGEHRLRDLSRPEQVFQVSAPGQVAVFPPLVSLDSFPGNLPLQVSSFIGRERELKRISQAIRDSRVVTLTGVGGVGKTRLALQVAADVLPSFREGAWLVELAPIRDPAAVSGAFAAVFGVVPGAGQSLEDSLVEFLGAKQLLLIVDNCEHLLGPAADLIEVIERSCGGVRILATSREGLAVEGERVVPVPSLSEPASEAGLAAMAQSDAVRLFVERALSVDPDFELSEDNATVVGQVCRRLDGIPLAIELAAARLRAMNPVELARGLDHRFDTLSGGRRRAVQRHQTLRAAIDWSYDLCSEPEHRLLARLAVFAGGCTRAAAEAVCGTAPIEPRATFGLLATLVDRSLVVAEREHPETRYRLLETIREYGEERLAEHAETDEVRTRHVEYYIGFAALIRDQMIGPGQVELGKQFVAEHENLLAAMNYSIDMDNADLALRLVYNIPGPRVQSGYTLPVSVEATLSLSGASDHPLYPFAVAVAAIRAAVRGDFEAAEAGMERSLDAARRLGDPDQRVEALQWSTRMFLAFERGATYDAARYAERMAAVSRTAGRLDDVANALGGAATFYAMAGDYDAALPLATEGLAIARDLDAPGFISLNLTALAGALVERDPAKARAILHESIENQTRFGYESMGEITQATLISARLGDWSDALALAGPAIRHLQWDGSWPLVASMMNVVARSLAADDPETAAVLQGAARQLIMTTNAPRGVSRADASHEASDGPTRRSARDFVTDLRRETSALLREALTDVQLRELRGQGERMQRDDAVSYALDAIAKASETTT